MKNMYEQKYLKYKAKYLNLQKELSMNQIGSNADPSATSGASASSASASSASASSASASSASASSASASSASASSASGATTASEDKAAPVAHVHNWIKLGYANYRCACGVGSSGSDNVSSPSSVSGHNLAGIPVAFGHVHNWLLIGVGNYRCACGAYMDDH